MHDTHMDPAIFEDPERFHPERWLDPEKAKQISKYLQPWGRGARLCLGMELAYYDLESPSHDSLDPIEGLPCAFSRPLRKMGMPALISWLPYPDRAMKDCRCPSRPWRSPEAG